jgi:hypothetical protein
MAASTGGSWKESLRFWWIRNGEWAGLVIVVLVLGGILALFRPVGPSTPLAGVVTAINVQGGRRQPDFNAWVDLGGGSQTVVGLSAKHGCVVGSRIVLRKARFSFGEHYAVSDHGCDTQPTRP